MCLTPCRVAIWFSILRATSVSSCDGDAPGSDAVTVTVGRSMSGKFWIFIARKLIAPTAVSMMKSRTPGIGFLIDQDETLIMALGGVARTAEAAPSVIAAGVVDDAHRVALGQEAAAGGDDAGVGGRARR